MLSEIKAQHNVGIFLTFRSCISTFIRDMKFPPDDPDNTLRVDDLAINSSYKNIYLYRNVKEY